MRAKSSKEEIHEYYVDDIRNFGSGENVQVIEAESPLEAAHKAFPNLNIARDLTNTGDIVVGRYTQQWYGRGYRTYVYRIEGTKNA